MSDDERFKSIAPENLKRVKELEINYFGIGCPIKAFMTYVYYSPYLLIVYFITYFLKSIKREKKLHLTSSL